MGDIIEKRNVRELLSTIGFSGIARIKTPYKNYNLSCLNGVPICMPNDEWRELYEFGIVEICNGSILICDDYIELDWVGFERSRIRHKNELIFNPTATILYKDGKKYVSKCDSKDTFDEEKGLMLCLLKSHGYTYSDIERLLKSAKRFGDKKGGK